MDLLVVVYYRKPCLHYIVKRLPLYKNMGDKDDKWEAPRHGEEVMSDDELGRFLTKEEVKSIMYFSFQSNISRKHTALCGYP